MDVLAEYAPKKQERSGVYKSEMNTVIIDPAK